MIHELSERSDSPAERASPHSNTPVDVRQTHDRTLQCRDHVVYRLHTDSQVHIIMTNGKPYTLYYDIVEQPAEAFGCSNRR